MRWLTIERPFRLSLYLRFVLDGWLLLGNERYASILSGKLMHCQEIVSNHLRKKNRPLFFSRFLQNNPFEFLPLASMPHVLTSLIGRVQLKRFAMHVLALTTPMAATRDWSFCQNGTARSTFALASIKFMTCHETNTWSDPLSNGLYRPFSLATCKTFSTSNYFVGGCLKSSWDNR